MTSKEEAKNKKGLIKGVKAELKKVTWLTPKQLVRNTIAVIIIVLIVTVIVFICDCIFKTINESIVNQVEKVITENQVELETNTTDTEVVFENEEVEDAEVDASNEE